MEVLTNTPNSFKKGDHDERSEAISSRELQVLWINHHKLIRKAQEGPQAYIIDFQWHQEVEKTESGPRQANLVLIAYASSEGSGEPAHPRSLARTSATRSNKQ